MAFATISGKFWNCVCAAANNSYGDMPANDVHRENAVAARDIISSVGDKIGVFVCRAERMGLTFQTGVLNSRIKRLFGRMGMAAPGNNSQGGPAERGVQDRLTEAAEELFCKRGFNETSVRDIAAAAGCNIASVNYYFGGKDNLYVEVWRRRLAELRDVRLASIEQVMSRDGQPQLEELLRSYANSFIEPLVEGGRSERFVSLMAREMVDPHLPRDMFLHDMIVPVMGAFTQALQRICSWLEPDQARLVILSIVGQLMQTVLSKGMFERGDHPAVPRLDLEEMVKHIVRFSAAGIRAYQGKPGE
jgi:AcrR family transcriptional regulator